MTLQRRLLRRQRAEAVKAIKKTMRKAANEAVVEVKAGLERAQSRAWERI